MYSYPNVPVTCLVLRYMFSCVLSWVTGETCSLLPQKPLHGESDRVMHETVVHDPYWVIE